MSLEHTVTIPSSISTVSGVLGLGLSKLDLSNHATCAIRFTQCSFGLPMPMLILGREIHALVRNNRHVKFTAYTRNSVFRGYADHVGFFRYCGFSRGREPGEATGSSNYIPIKILDLNDLRQAADGRPYGEIMESVATDLAGVLLQTDRGAVYETVRYSLREILRNSIEHSQGSQAVVFGQCWPRKNKAEIALYDTGVGISSTLSEAGLVDGRSHIEAINLAMQPGVTGVSEAERAHQPEDYRNSGFGLYTTSRLFSEVGFFRMVSGDAGVTISPNGRTDHEWNFAGTCVHLSCELNKMSDAKVRLDRIVAEGEEAIGMIGSASVASKSIKI